MKKYLICAMLLLTASVMVFGGCSKNNSGQSSEIQSSTSSISSSSSKTVIQPPPEDSTYLSSNDGSSQQSQQSHESSVIPGDDQSYPDYSEYEDLANEIAESWLNDQTLSVVDDDERISEYKINSVEVWNKSDNAFEIKVTYDILPANPDAFLFAGNGEEGDNGWYVGLMRYIRAEKIHGEYIVTSIGTSPSM